MMVVFCGRKTSLILVALCAALSNGANGQLFGIGRTKKVDADVSTKRKRGDIRPLWKKSRKVAAGAIENIADLAEDVVEDVQDFVEDVGEVVVASPVFAGKVRPALRKLALTKEKVAAVTQAISDATQTEDLAFLGVMGWALVPAVEFFYELGDDDDDGGGGGDDDDGNDTGDRGADANSAAKGKESVVKRPFLKSVAFQIAGRLTK